MMKLKNIIFDLNGTLIDSKLRLYKLFQHLVPSSTLSYQDYWGFKKRKISNQSILREKFGFENSQIERFIIDWMALIESPQFLLFDKNLEGVHTALESVRSFALLHVCTHRQNKQAVNEQLENLGLMSFFESVMVTEQVISKRDLIVEIQSLGSEDWFVGDTGVDVEVGKSLNIKTCGVLSGFLNRQSLEFSKPDLIKPSIVEFCEYSLRQEHKTKVDQT
jgi:phosphoglycolate phosphatase